jgi:hypothetical protein
MKTKTLLIAAAALAAGVISSQAQVYSQNIVGYANLACPTGGKNYLITCPFTVGVSNGLNEVFGSTLPVGSSVLIWNGVNNYITALYDNTDPNGYGTNVVWYQSDGATPLSPVPCVPPGQGFFLIPATPLTNTFTGSVAVAPGTNSVINMATGGKNYLVASTVPYAGAITNGNSSGGGPNLNNLSVGTSLLFWNGVNNYRVALFDNTDPNGYGTSVQWYQADGATPYVDPGTSGNVPNISVGQGFFVIPAIPYNWTNGLAN